jgi:cytosine/adenosine deaminase-related metal-dependent hydrolase
VLPIGGAPIRAGHVSTSNGRIVGVGSGRHGTDIGRAAILPALVNAHTHLELSYLRGRVPPSGRFVDWVRELLRLRAGEAEAGAAVGAAARHALGEAISSGTGVIGDVSNTLATPLAAVDAPVPGVVFLEVLGFRSDDAQRRVADARRRIEARRWPSVSVALAPHAPYSVSPAMFAALRSGLGPAGSTRSTIHVAESPEEVQLLRDGSGPWREALEAMGVWDETWTPPRASPIDYLDALGFLRPDVLAVHVTQASSADIDRIAARGATVVLCPRSNRHVGVGDPPAAALYARGVPVALGTDSLASTPDLNLFEEMAEVRRLAPDVPAARILDSATRRGAVGLGLGTRYGTLTPGAAASIVAVRVPDAVDDVEEYLVSGVRAQDVSWLSGPRSTV